MAHLDDGKYRAKATQWGLAKAGTGTPQVCVLFDLLDLPGQSITFYGSLTDASYERTVEGMRACGWQGIDLSDLAGLDTNEVQIVVKNEEYPEGSGKWSTKVKWINSLGGLAMTAPIVGDDLRAFAAQMRGKIAALDPSKAKQQRTAQTARAAVPQRQPQPPPRAVPDNFAPPPDGDDSLPF